MAEEPPKSTAPSSAIPDPPKNVPKSKPVNPALQAMGLGFLRARLPSRNWLIFLTLLTGTTSLILYDKRRTRQTLAKYQSLVSHLRLEPLAENQLPRTITVYLAASPGDSIRVGREEFHEFVKPILVEGGCDWVVVEGRQEGVVRGKVAERVRRFRREMGEHPETEGQGQEEEEDEEARKERATRELRRRVGTREWEGVAGDLVLGRHTWKEYVRGVHEGWLGPLEARREAAAESGLIAETGEVIPPAPASVDTPTDTPIVPPEAATTTPDSPLSTDSPSSSPQETTPAAAEPSSTTTPEKPKKPTIPPPHIPPSLTAYSSSPLPPSMPSIIGPSAVIPLPHILGFLNTPTRIYRFMTRRYLAEDIGRRTAALVLGEYRGFHSEGITGELGTGMGGSGSGSGFVNDASPSAASSSPSPLSSSSSSSSSSSAPSSTLSAGQWEQQTILSHEEADYPKSVRKRNPTDTKERVWLDTMVLDPRIAERMKVFELAAAEEERARRIGESGGKDGVILPKDTREEDA